jgi:HEPN domain-containing protein
MKPTTREWVEKAEADLTTAFRELRARRKPNYDAACFHAQQCVEKFLEARLTEAGIRFGKTHDLEQLLDLVIPAEPLWSPFRSSLNRLNSYAVNFRYPGETATRGIAQTAVGDARLVCRQIRESLGLAAPE